MMDALLALAAILLCRANPRMVGLCLIYAGTRLAFVAFAPPPDAWHWYLLCVFGEAAVAYGALLVQAPASRFIAMASMIGMVVHTLAAIEYPTESTVIFTLYPYVINYFVEAAQVAALYFFSPPVLTLFTRRPVNVKEGDASWIQARWTLE